MSKRLQVLLDEDELRDIRRAARRQRLTVAEWVRRALRAAREAEDGPDDAAKMELVRVAATHAFPTSDLDGMTAASKRVRPST